jgi:hypothetical protein
MKIENTEVFGFKAAMHGMRNPMNSWDKSDSIFYPNGTFTIGEADNFLAKKLIRAGKDHRKFLRFIHIQCFISIPRYIWQELDTYKVATTRLSCSTMHKLGSTDLTKQDFQDDYVLLETLAELNRLGNFYRTSKTVSLLREMKQILPEGFLQAADYDFCYETAFNIYHARKDHRMSEWSEDGICKWIEGLPMMNEWLHLEKK